MFNVLPSLALQAPISQQPIVACFLSLFNNLNNFQLSLV